MNNLNEGIRFYGLGSQKIDFSKIPKSFNLDTSKPVIASKDFNKALNNVIDNDIKFLKKSLKKLIDKVNKLLSSKCENLSLKLDDSDDILFVKNNISDIIKNLTEYKLKNKVGFLTLDKKNKKEKHKKLEECISSLNEYQKEIISMELEYNKLLQRKNKIVFEETEIEQNEKKHEDPLERTISFYMGKDQKN